MSSYILELPNIGEVQVTKKRGMRSFRLRVTAKGDIALSAPWYVTKRDIEAFAISRSLWIKEHASKHRVQFVDGMTFGRGMKLYLRDNQLRNSSKVTGIILWVKLKDVYTATDAQNSYIEKKMLAAMLTQAEILLLPRLQALADQTDHTFNQAFVKRLSSRWGSCDSHKNIILNVYMLQLPDKLVDYVILHELTHTVHMNHSAAFWGHLQTHCPNAKYLRKKLHDYEPRIQTTDFI